MHDQDAMNLGVCQHIQVRARKDIIDENGVKLAIAAEPHLDEITMSTLERFLRKVT